MVISWPNAIFYTFFRFINCGYLSTYILFKQQGYIRCTFLILIHLILWLIRPYNTQICNSSNHKFNMFGKSMHLKCWIIIHRLDDSILIKLILNFILYIFPHSAIIIGSRWLHWICTFKIFLHLLIVLYEVLASNVVVVSDHVVLGGKIYPAVIVFLDSEDHCGHYHLYCLGEGEITRNIASCCA